MVILLIVLAEDKLPEQQFIAFFEYVNAYQTTAVKRFLTRLFLLANDESSSTKGNINTYSGA